MCFCGEGGVRQSKGGEKEGVRRERGRYDEKERVRECVSLSCRGRYRCGGVAVLVGGDCVVVVRGVECGEAEERGVRMEVVLQRRLVVCC